MKKRFAFAILFCGLQVTLFAQQKPAPALSPHKQAVLKSVEAHEKDLVRLSDQVWAFAETALREHQSAKVLPTTPRGFRVERGRGWKPTALLPPLGEYDALPGLHKRRPQKNPCRRALVVTAAAPCSAQGRRQPQRR